MAEKIKVFTIEIQGISKEAEEINKLNASLDRLNQERKELSKQSKTAIGLTDQQAKRYRTLGTEIEAARQKRNKLNQTERTSIQLAQSQVGSIDRMRLENKKLRQQMGQLNLTTKDGQAQFKKLNVQYQKNLQSIRNYDRQLSGSSTLVGEYEKGFTAAFRKIALSVFAVVTAIRTLTRAVQNTTKDFADFETGQTNVQTLLDEFDDTLSRKSIALVKQYGLEINDMNKALFDAVSAGVPVAESVDFLAEATQLAVGGVTDLSTAVDGITSVLNGYNLKTEEAGRVAAAFFSAQKFGKTTVAELAQEVGTVVPVANMLNVTYQELLTTYAELTKQGIRTNEASTAIKGTMTALLKPSSEAKKVFDDLGIAYGAANVKQVGFFNILQQISEAVEEGTVGLAEIIPNVRALTGVGALGTRQLKEYHEFLKVVNEDYGEGSSLARAFNLQQQTLTQTTNRIKGAFRAARISLGEYLEPAVRWFGDLIAPVKEVSDSLIDQQVELQNLGVELDNNWEKEEDRRKVLDEINKQYPALLTGMNLETASLEQIKSRLREANEEYLKRIVLQQAQEDIDKEGRKVAKKKNKELEKEIELRRQIAIAASKMGILVADLPEGLNEQAAAIDKAAREAGRYDEVVSGMDGTIKGFLSGDNLATAFSKYQGATEGTYGAMQILNMVQSEANEKAKLLFGVTTDTTEALTKEQQILADLTSGLITFEEAQKRLINLTRTTTTPTEGGTVTTPTGGESKPAGPSQKEIDRAAKVEAERLKLTRRRVDAEIALEEDKYQKIFLMEQTDFERTVEDLERMKQVYPELESEINQLIEAEEARHNAEMVRLAGEAQEEITAKNKTEADKRKAEAEAERQAVLTSYQGYFTAAAGLVEAFTNVFAAAKAKELSAVGDNAEKREAIEKKYAKREQVTSIAKALIGTALAVINALQTQPFLPMGPIMAVIAGAAGLAQIGIIRRQRFADSGVVQPGSEISGLRGKDNTLVMAHPGEVFLNKKHQALLGGANTFRRIGVPGFEKSGIVPPIPNLMGAETDAMVTGIGGLMQTIRVVNYIQEMHEAEDDLKLVNESAEL